jgi:lipopolysaccharide transport system permease protein
VGDVGVTERPSVSAPGDGALTETPSEKDARVTTIRPSTKWPRLDIRELWHFRELLLVLVWRDVAVRYKQTAIGVAWAIVVPFVTMIVFTLVFGKFADFPSKGVPYPIFTYSALLPWTYFASALAASSACLTSNKSLVTKVYFPRILLPLSAVTVPAFDLLFASILLGGMMVWFSVWPSIAILLSPFFLLLSLFTALGTGLFLSAVNVRYRDVPYAVPFLIQIWLYVSGVVYAINALPEHWQWVLALNPVSASISGFQWGVLGTSPPEIGKLAVSLASLAVIFLVGLWYFRRSEPRFADTI